MEEDYPRNLLEFETRFSSDEACRTYLMNLRWPNGFTCPRCSGLGGWPTKRNLVVCRHCEYQVSITAGTIFQDTRKPLTLWFRAMWWVTTQKHGSSALGLQRELGLKTYWTAWTWLHKMRRAMVRPGRDQLNGTVEVDETYWGAEEKGVIGRLTYEKAIIIAAVEEDGRGIGRIRLKRIADLSRTTLHRFIKDCVEPGSIVRTDGLNAYGQMVGYQHQAKVIGQGKVAGSEVLPLVHRVISLLKRWMLGTHQGAMSAEHMDFYLDEFAFRFNRRKSSYRGKLFYRLVQQAVQVAPVTYSQMIRHISSSTNHKG
jgi:transposase-like protein